MTFAPLRRNLPVLDSCEGCGLCCTEQALLPVSWYLGPSMPGETVALPPEIMSELRERLALAQIEGFPRDGTPCFWYDAATKKCKHYEHRPDICRDEVKLNDEHCQRWRRDKALPASTGQRFGVRDGRMVRL